MKEGQGETCQLCVLVCVCIQMRTVRSSVCRQLAARDPELVRVITMTMLLLQHNRL